MVSTLEVASAGAPPSWRIMKLLTVVTIRASLGSSRSPFQERFTSTYLSLGLWCKRYL